MKSIIKYFNFNLLNNCIKIREFKLVRKSILNSLKIEFKSRFFNNGLFIKLPTLIVDFIQK